jgi:hypothetical protein
MIQRLLSLSLILLFFLSACQTETEIVRVSGNQAAPDLTVPQVVKENYINKLYIGLLGRKPSPTEQQQALSLLNRSEASPADREALLDQILAQDAFALRMYEVAKAEMLNNIDSSEIQFQIFIFRELLKDPQYEAFYPLIQTEIDKLLALRNLPQRLRAGQQSRAEMHAIMSYNYFYDEINMGSQNFVLSLFEYFLGRYPTADEEQKAIQMVDGFGMVMFGQEGSSKEDFISIFFQSTDYLEGQAIDLYNDFLLREPSSTEMAEAVLAYRSQNSYLAMLKLILTKDDALGWES